MVAQRVGGIEVCAFVHTYSQAIDEFTAQPSGHRAEHESGHDQHGGCGGRQMSAMTDMMNSPSGITTSIGCIG
jgi:hypothetical protein